MPPLEGQERIIKPALTQSLFPSVSSTIYFGTRDERGKGNPLQVVFGAKDIDGGVKFGAYNRVIK